MSAHCLHTWGRTTSRNSQSDDLGRVRQPDVASLQIIFNLFRQKPIHTLFEEARKRSVGLLVGLPLANGLLAGKYTQTTRFPAEDHRNFNRDGQQFNVGETFAGLPIEKGVELADRLKLLVPKDLTLGDMARVGAWISTP